MTPLSLGINTVEGVTTITTCSDNQRRVFRASEKECAICDDTNLLGNFELTDALPDPHDVPQFEFTFDTDADGIQTISATDKITGSEDKITLGNVKGCLSNEDIERMVKDDEKYKIKDEDEVLALERYMFDMTVTMIKAEKIEAEKIVEFEENCDKVEGWLEEYVNVLEKVCPPPH